MKIKKIIAVFSLCLGFALLVPTTANAENVTEYTVKKGDTLWKISKTFLGDGQRYTEIVEKNKDIIKNADLIYPGMQLIIDCDSDYNYENDTDSTDSFYDEYVYEVRGDNYQRAEIYIGHEYIIKANEKIGDDYFIMIDPDVAEIKDGKIVAKAIGAGVVFYKDKNGEIKGGWSLAVLEPGAYGVWTNDKQWVYETNGKKIKSVKSSDESIATASFEGNKVFAHGQKIGTCKFKIDFEDGTNKVFVVNDIGDYSELYDYFYSEVEKNN